MSYPPISPLPPEPTVNDSTVDFEAKALEFVDSLDTFGDQQNALAEWMQDTAADVALAKAAAQSAAATAAVDAAAAASATMAGVTAARDAAEDAQEVAEDARDLSQLHAAASGTSAASALTAAAAAAAAAGLPSLTGNAGKPLRVTRSGSGVAFDFGPAGRLVTDPIEPGIPIAAVCGDIVDCRVSGRAVNLPASPANLDWVTVVPNGHLPTIDPGDESVNGIEDTIIIDSNRPHTFVYMADIGTWRVF